MNVHVSYKAGKTPDVEREFKHQIQKLERRLQVFKPDWCICTQSWNRKTTAAQARH